MAGKLNAKAVDALRTRGFFPDGGGLYLQVKPNPKTGYISKSWVYRYSCGGRRRDMGLGKVADVSLGKARQKAQRARELRADGKDPIEERKHGEHEERLAASRAKTFRQVAEECIESKKAGWKNAKHVQQWSSTLAKYVYPVFGSVPVADITAKDVQKALLPIWTTKEETARRVRGRIEKVLGYAAVQGLRPRENPARLDGYLSELLSTQRREVRHHLALPFKEAPGFMQKLSEQPGLGAKALKFTVLTAARTGEVVGAKWSEFDLKNRLWTVPAERMKMHRQHRVPLSTAAVDLLNKLKETRGRNEHVFGVPKSKKPPSNMMMLAVLKRMGLKGQATTHGFRSTFRDWCAENRVDPSVAEAALSHASGTKVEQAYFRTDMLDHRKEVMQKWCNYSIAPTAAFDPSRKVKKNLQL